MGNTSFECRHAGVALLPSSRCPCGWETAALRPERGPRRELRAMCVTKPSRSDAEEAGHRRCSGCADVVGSGCVPRLPSGAPTGCAGVFTRAAGFHHNGVGGRVQGIEVRGPVHEVDGSALERASAFRRHASKLRQVHCMRPLLYSPGAVPRPFARDHGMR